MKSISRRLLFVFFCGLTLLAIAGTNDVMKSYKPAEGYVPTQGVAVMIAEAVLIPIYGKEKIDRQKPFKAVLKGDVWFVEGVLRSSKGTATLGGVATIQISKISGEILLVTHSK